jgi:hypothetical protein
VPYAAARLAVLAGLVLAVPAPVCAGEDAPPAPGSTVSTMPVPGGLRGALAVLDDPVPPDRSQFFVEVIRRAYQPPLGANRQPAVDRAALLAYFDRAEQAGQTAGADETVPLPLTPEFWIDVVFGGRVTVDGLARAIVDSRPAALLYVGLLSLDDATRTWLAAERPLVTTLLTRHAAAFLLIAPGFRVSNGLVRVPGGDAARPAWEAIVGCPATDAPCFAAALVEGVSGRLPLLYGALSTLSGPQVRFLLGLDSGNPGASRDALRRLQAVFARVAGEWDVERWSFRRPALDPSLLVASLPADERGRPQLPGTRRFWEEAFSAEAARPRRPTRDRAFVDGEPVEPAWLCEQVFQGEPAEQRRRYNQVLFAARVVPRIAADSAADALDVVRAARQYPALTAVVERLGLRDPAALARVVRRVDQLAGLGNDARAIRALTQFQGALAIVARGAARGGLPAEARSALVSSLAEIAPSARGDYDGRLASWLATRLQSLPGAPASWLDTVAATEAALLGPVERDVLRLLAAPLDAAPVHVDWEGTRYRIDLAAAEARRIAQHLGTSPRPYLSSAHALAVMADAADAGATPAPEALQRIAREVGWDPAGEWQRTDAPERYRQALAGLRRHRGSDRRGTAGHAATAAVLRGLADDLLARGLIEMLYATALGPSESARITAEEAARRHDFGLDGPGAAAGHAWQLPAVVADRDRGWHLHGSLLALDVQLAELSLLRRSARMPSRRPSVSEEDRRVFVAAAVLVEPAAVGDADRDRIVTALRRGRARLAEVRSAADAAALAEEIALDGVRRSLLPWVALHDPGRLAASLSLTELLWLGLDGASVEAPLHAWGTPAGPRLGCLCLQVPDRLPWERSAGRWGTGLLASGFPDLNLRVAELLAAVGMPARLLGPVLASATLDLIDIGPARDEDDRRGLVEFVQTIGTERMEEYLALLTTDGPLVPVEATELTRTGGR